MCTSGHGCFSSSGLHVLILCFFSEFLFLFYQHYTVLCVSVLFVKKVNIGKHFMCCSSCLFCSPVDFFCFISTCVRDRGRWGGAKGEREPQADSPLSAEPSAGLSPTTLSWWPEPKAGVRPSSESPGTPMLQGSLVKVQRVCASLRSVGLHVQGPS